MSFRSLEEEGDAPISANEGSDGPSDHSARFQAPKQSTKEQLRAVKGIHDKMARNLASQVSAIMRSIVEIQLHSVGSNDVW